MSLRKLIPLACFMLPAVAIGQLPGEAFPPVIWYTDQATLLASACPAVEDNAPNGNLLGIAEAQQELWHCDGTSWSQVGGAGVTGCSNGINLDGSDCQLGGVLVENTTVNGSNLFNLTLDNIAGLTLDATGVGNGIVGTASDGDITLTATGINRLVQLSSSGAGGDVVVSSADTASLVGPNGVSILAIGTGADIAISAEDNVSIGLGTITNSVAISTMVGGIIRVGNSSGPVRLLPHASASPPFGCSLPHRGELYLDTAPSSALCICLGTSWEEMAMEPGGNCT